MVPWVFEYATLLSLPLAALVVLGGAWLTIFIGGRKSRTQGKDRRAALGEAATDLSADDEDRVVTLVGRLRVIGDACARYDDGQPMAAATFEVSAARTWFEAPDFEAAAHRRAEELVLMVGDRPVKIEGPVAVRVGSREYWPANDVNLTDEATARVILEDGGFDPRRCDGFGVYRSIASDTQVIARGRAARSRPAADQALGYRDAALRWQLHAGDAFAVELASLRGPAYRTRRNILAAGQAFLVAGAIVAYAALALDVDESDVVSACDEACLDKGRCDSYVEFETFRVVTKCGSKSGVNCGRRRACLEKGLCTPVDGLCLATTRQGCAPTAPCLASGLCTPKEGLCQVVSNEDCVQSAACREDGLCTANFDQIPARCAYGSDADCEKTSDCKTRGLCTFSNGRCITAKPRDCENARYCRTDGLCSYDPTRGLCFAKDDGDCIASRACTEQGRCRVLNDVCRR